MRHLCECRCPNFRFFSSPHNDTKLRSSSKRETLENSPIWIIFIMTVNHFQIKFSFKRVYVRHELLQSDLFLRLLPELPERNKSEENLARSENKIIIESVELWQIDRFIRFMLLLANWFQSRWTWLTERSFIAQTICDCFWAIELVHSGFKSRNRRCDLTMRCHNANYSQE